MKTLPKSYDARADLCSLKKKIGERKECEKSGKSNENEP